MPAEGQADLAHPEAADWALGTLETAGSQEFQQHVAGCGHCQVAVSEFGYIGRILQHLPPAAEPPSDLEARTIDSVLDATAGDRTQTHLPRISAALPAAARSASPGSAAQLPLAPPQLASYYRPSPGPRRPRSVPMAGAGAAGAGAAAGAPATPNPAGGTLTQPPPRRRRVGWYAGAGAVVAVIAAAIAFLPGFSGSTSAEPPVDGTGPPVVIPLRSAPGTAASGQAAAQRMPGGWSIQLSVHGLKPLAAGEFYECWFAGAGNKPGHLVLISAGTFSAGRSGSASVSMWSAADPRQFRTAEITAQTPGRAGQLGRVILSGVART